MNTITIGQSLKIQLLRKRNPGLRGRTKRDGQAGSYCLLMHGKYLKTQGEKKNASSRQNSWKTPWRPWTHLSNILAAFMCCFCAFSQCAWSVFAHLHCTGMPNDSTNETVADQYLARIIPRELKCCLVRFSLVKKASFPSKLLKWASNL